MTVDDLATLLRAYHKAPYNFHSQVLFLVGPVRRTVSIGDKLEVNVRFDADGSLLIELAQ